MIAVHQPLPLAGVSLGGGPPTASASQVLRRQLDERVQEAVAALSSDVEASAELTDGYPDQVLRDKSAEFDLLVLGSRGYGPLRAVLLGSVSSGLVRSAASPWSSSRVALRVSASPTDRLQEPGLDFLAEAAHRPTGSPPAAQGEVHDACATRDVDLDTSVASPPDAA